MSSSDHSATRSRPGLRAVVASLSAILAIGLLGVVPAAAVPATPGPGFMDFVYKPDADGTGGDDVTSFRNQSKLWFNDGRWWGILFDKGSTANGTYRIQSLNMTAQTWTTSTSGAQVDNRNRSNADALWDGTNLYVVSSHDHGRNWAPNGDLRLYKYSYSSATQTYALLAGFPKTLATNGPDPDPVNKILKAAGTDAATIAKASDGSLWIAYMQQIDPNDVAAPIESNVKVIHVSSAGAILSGPVVLPNQGATPPTTDDMAAITTVGTTAGHRGVGVLWSNQTAGEEAFYFVAHTDGVADATWGTRETAFGGSGTATADGHISLKTDADGRVIAAVKTNRTGGSSALIDVIARTGNSDAAGSWSNRIVSSVSQHGTRPILVLDSEASQADVFFTNQDNPQKIYRRTASLSTLDFGSASLGAEFIRHDATATINNATSTKQITDATSGILVLAADIPTRTYFHGCTGGPCPAVPVAAFSGSPTSGQGPLSVQFTDASTGHPATWAWTFGDGATSTDQNPSHTYNPGDYTVSLTVTNAAGSDSETKTDYIHVTVPPGATYVKITPTRFLDTRTGNGLSGKFTSSVPRSFQITGRNGIPAGAVAITGNLTVTGQNAAGYVFLGPTAPANPTSSTLNFPTGDTRANAVSVSLSGSGGLEAVFKAGSGKTTHLILDVTGYYVGDSSGATYTATVPTRFLDTRTGNGLSGKFVANTPRNDLQITGRNGIPAGAIAISGNLTVTGQTKAGYVFLGPTASANPTSSTLNFPTGDTRANAVVVPLSATGSLGAVYKAGSGTTDLILDVTGYYTNDSSGARYFPLAPTRLLDDRTGTGLSGKFVANTPRNFQITSGSGAVPTSATAVTGNLTVTGQTKAGYVFLGPTAPANPTSSTLNFPKGDTRANAVSVSLSGSGSLGAVYKAGSGTTDLILDVTGYFQ